MPEHPSLLARTPITQESEPQPGLRCPTRSPAGVPSPAGIPRTDLSWLTSILMMVKSGTGGS